jgi:hypothetical protein
MPTISSFYGMLIQMYWDEHAPPHFHAIYGDYKACVNIRDLTEIVH